MSGIEETREEESPKARGWWLYERERYDMVLDEVQRMLAEDPHDADAFVLASLANTGLGKHDGAVTAARQAIASTPDAPYPRYILARALNAQVRAGRMNGLQADRLVKEARKSLEEGIKLEPNAVYCYEFLGRFELAAKRYKKALALANAGLAIDPNHDASLVLGSQALRAMGRTAEADARVRLGLASSPENPYAHQALGLTLMQAGRFEEAKEAFWAALRIEPTLYDARDGLWRVIKAQNFMPYRWRLAMQAAYDRLGAQRQGYFILGLFAIVVGLAFMGEKGQMADVLLVLSLPLITVLYYGLVPVALVKLRITGRHEGMLQRYQRRMIDLAGGALAVSLLSLAGLFVWQPAEHTPTERSLAVLLLGSALFAILMIGAADASEPTRRRGLVAVALGATPAGLFYVLAEALRLPIPHTLLSLLVEGLGIAGIIAASVYQNKRGDILR